MTAKGYATTTTTGQVSKWYGADLTTAQATQAAAWLEAAENLIDAATGLPFGAGAVVGERVYPDGPYVFLRRAPINSGTPIVVKGYLRGDTTATTLTLTSQYEMDDWMLGRLYLPGWADYALFTVDYTPVTAIPVAISEATAALLADWLTHNSADAPSGPMTRTKVGDVEVQYASASSQAEAQDTLPSRVRQLLAPYLAQLIFA